ncbi:Ger(x)C family spore germination protein [Metabacillus idriensis]|uniref:Ger(x)C family spore germination protein n=1 Tax=Metabacillus idriensis TaxID=324768 RepID=UPI003D291043
MGSLKRTAVFIIFVLIVSILSGCWDNRDINHRVMPVVLGISKKGEDYKVFLQIPEPLEDSIETKIVSGGGKTINQAVNNISVNMESSVDLLHVKVIVIEKRLAEEGMKDLFGGFIRSRDISSKALVAICEDNMDEFFASMVKRIQPEGTTLLDFFEKNAGWDPKIALTRVWQVYRSIHSYTRDVAIPMLRLGKTTLVEQIGSAVIKNGKLVEAIDSNETLLFNAFNGESTQGEIEVLNDASVLILDNSMKNKSKFKDQLPLLHSEIKLTVMILETKGDPSEKQIKKELEVLLTKRFNEMFKKLQNSEADILGLGQYFRNKIPRKRLKDWRSKYYQELYMDFKVHVDIQNAGNLKTPSN